MTGSEMSLYGMLLTLSVWAGIGKGRQLTALASGWRLGDLPQQTPMLKVGIPCLILAVVVIHLGLAHPALSRHLPLGLKTVETALSLASLVALCTFAFTTAAAVAFRLAHPARWALAGSGLLVIGIDLLIVWSLYTPAVRDRALDTSWLPL
jgi:hypothetical protein